MDQKLSIDSMTGKNVLTAMLVLILPAFLICAAVAVVIYRKWGDSK